MNKLQKIKNSIRKFVTSPRFSSLALMLLVGTVACLAQNTAGNYEAGTSALTTVTEEIAKYVPIVSSSATPSPASWPSWARSASISP